MRDACVGRIRRSYPAGLDSSSLAQCKNLISAYARAVIVYWVQDLLFTSKIRETARTLGQPVEAARDVAQLVAAAPKATLMILDLRRPGALDAISSIKLASATVKIVGFVDHEAVDTFDKARALGCVTLAKGKFSSDLPTLLAP